jgi:hypothetical protein
MEDTVQFMLSMMRPSMLATPEPCRRDNLEVILHAYARLALECGVPRPEVARVLRELADSIDAPKQPKG